MKENKYTSLELSKKLAEGGCELESECIFVYDKSKGDFFIEKIHIMNTLFKTELGFLKICNTYDILNDICCKYCREFFGEEYKTTAQGGAYKRYEMVTPKIFILRQQNKKQEAEDYIWENCLFNKEKRK